MKIKLIGGPGFKGHPAPKGHFGPRGRGPMGKWNWGPLSPNHSQPAPIQPGTTQ